MRLDFLRDVFLDEELDGGPIAVDEYRLYGRSDEWMRVEEGGTSLTMVSVLLTSWKGLGLPRQLPNPIAGPRRDLRENSTPGQPRLLEFLTRLKSARRLSSYFLVGFLTPVRRGISLDLE